VEGVARMMVSISPADMKKSFRNLSPLTKKQLSTQWGQHRNALRNHVATENAYNFLNWSTITATMFVGDFEVTQQELLQLRASPRAEVYYRAIQENDIGYPPRMKGAEYTSGSLVHQMYHLMQWERITGKQVENLKEIVEFGGGYGAMYAIAHRMGFKGKYWIFDFSEMLILQQFYLSNLGILWGQDVTMLDVEKLDKEWVIKPDLLIAIHSLSEAPIEKRDDFVTSCKPNSALFTYQEKFDDIDNKNWFTKFLLGHPEFHARAFGSKYHKEINYLICDQEWVRNG
jgi:hypothetical protein